MGWDEVNLPETKDVSSPESRPNFTWRFTGFALSSEIMSDVIPGIDTTVFDLSGAHYDIGVAIGRASQPFTLPAWWPQPPALDFALACSREIAALHPGLLDEIHGHADGQKLSYNELLRLICRQRLGGRTAAVV